MQVPLSGSPKFVWIRCHVDLLRDPTLVGEENETFLIRVWKSICDRCVKRKYLLGVDLDRYKLYKR